MCMQQLNDVWLITRVIYDGFIVSLTWQNKILVDEVIALLLKKMNLFKNIFIGVYKALFSRSLDMIPKKKFRGFT
jgi:uncharacterized protein YutE (UPF0331/DUF86 family)